jgi:hypothetical protein
MARPRTSLVPMKTTSGSALSPWGEAARATWAAAWTYGGLAASKGDGAGLHRGEGPTGEPDPEGGAPGRARTATGK